MTYDDISKKITSGEKLFNIPLRVCFYARVSTDSDVQLNSLDNQLDYYKKYIQSKPNWIYYGGYIEEGVTGVSVDKRTSFKKMINDAKNNQFDLIITKEVSRFARDLEDSIHYIRILKESNVGIFFENQNLNTFDPNSELILNIMFNLAQDESRKLSSRIKFGHRQAIEKGHILGSSNITGYKKDNCKLVIDKEEAKFIKILFELYATGEYGFLKLSKKLDSLGYRNKSNKPYDKNTLKKMIQNPKYKGYYRAKVHEIIDYRTKKRKTNKIEDQIIYKCNDDRIPPIVSTELWNKANEILIKRTKNYQNNNYHSNGLKYPFSSKLYCSNCHKTFQRSHGSKRKKRPIWCCSNYLQYSLDACISPIIAEIDLYNIFETIMNKLIPNKNIIINNLLKLYKDINKNNTYQNELNIIKNKINKLEEKKSIILDLTISGEIKKETFKIQLNKIDNEINNLIKNKTNILNQIKLSNHNQDNLDKISNIIQKEINQDILNSFIKKFTNKIFISKINNERNNLKLDIYLNLTNNNNNILYLKEQKYNSIEVKRTIDIPNKFTYNLYIN